MAKAQGTSEGILSYVGTTIPEAFGPIEAFIPGTVGWTFKPLTSISVTALGGFAYNLPSGSTCIGLWASGGTLLASNTVTSSSTLIDQSFYEAITPVALTQNQTYYLGEFSTLGPIESVVVDPGDGAPFGYAITDPEIQLGNVAYEANSDFGFPSVVDGSPNSAIIAPNFEFQPVPEPSTIWLVYAGLLVFSARRHFSPDSASKFLQF